VNGCINPNTTDSRQFYGEPAETGYGGNACTIKFDDSALSNTDSCIYAPTSVRNLSVEGTSTNAIGIEFRNASGSAGQFGSYQADNVWVSGCFKAFTFDSMYSSYFRGLQAYLNTHGFWVVPVNSGGNTGYFTTTTFEDCFANQNTGYGWYVAPPLKSPNLSFLNCSFEGVSSTETHIAYISSNVDPFIMDNPYVELAGGTTASMLLNGFGTVKGMYDNSTGGIDLGAGSSRVIFQNLKPTASSIGFLNGTSANASISINSGSLNSTPSASSNGNFDDLNVTGSNKTWRFKRSTTVDKSFPADGSTNNVLTLDFGGTYSHAGLSVPFYIYLVSGGIVYQSCMGILNISYMNFGTNASFSNIATTGLVKAETTGTLSDPVFTVTHSGSEITLQCAVTTTQVGYTASIQLEPSQVFSTGSIFPIINTV